MKLRFRKTVKILPGLKLNFGKSGVSVTLGGRGAGITINKKGIFSNAGLTGPGLSYRKKIVDFGREIDCTAISQSTLKERSNRTKAQSKTALKRKGVAELDKLNRKNSK